MPVSLSEHRERFCAACGYRDVALTWLVIDLFEHPDLREAFQRADAYHWTCPRCQHDGLRDTPLLVLNASPVAPVLLAGPGEMFELDDPAAGSSALIERARRALDAEHRSLPGPLLPVPFGVLALALGRDIKRDATEPDLAVREVEAVAGLVAGQLYRIFMGDVEGSMSSRRIDAAMNAFWSISSPEDLERAVIEHPELVGEEARERLRSIIGQAAAAGDEVGVALANAQLALLERCAEGHIAEGFAEYVEEPSYSELVDPQLQELWDRLAEARQHDPALAVSIGEELIEFSARFHRVASEAAAAYDTASIYWNHTGGDRVEEVERAIELLERALELCKREPTLVQPDLRLAVTVNLAAAVGARGRGDPAANQERALELHRDALGLVSPETDGRRWAMIETNLGLSLVERARTLDRRLQDQEEAARRAQALIAEAIGHFEAALSWRSFERDPGDWAYTQVNLGLAYAHGPGGERGDELREAIGHTTEAIRGFTAASDLARLSRALSNRALAKRDLAAVEQADAPQRRALLEEAVDDARQAIEVVGEDAGGLEAGRRWWQLGRVLAARDGYSAQTAGAFERALRDLTPAVSPHDCRDAARELADLATTAGDWHKAAPLWAQAAEAGLAAVEMRASLAGRLSEVAANGNVFRWAAYAMTRIGQPQHAIELLERGRALQLTTWLGADVVELAPLRELSPDLCSRFVDLRRRVELGERDASAVEDPDFPRTVEEMRQTIEEIRKLPGLEAFLTQPTLNELVSRLPREEAIAYPLTSPWGSAWLVANASPQGGLDVHMVELPAITSTGVFETLVRYDSAAKAPRAT